MTLEEVNEYATENDVNIVVFSNPDYSSAILGITHDDRVVYDYELMVDDLMKKDNITREEAIEFIDYNTLRSLSYYEHSPVILTLKEY